MPSLQENVDLVKRCKMHKPIVQRLQMPKGLVMVTKKLVYNQIRRMFLTVVLITILIASPCWEDHKTSYQCMIFVSGELSEVVKGEIKSG